MRPPPKSLQVRPKARTNSTQSSSKSGRTSAVSTHNVRVPSLFLELTPVVANLTLAAVGQLRTPVGKPELIAALSLDFKDIGRTSRGIKIDEPAFQNTYSRNPDKLAAWKAPPTPSAPRRNRDLPSPRRPRPDPIRSGDIPVPTLLSIPPNTMPATPARAPSRTTHPAATRAKSDARFPPRGALRRRDPRSQTSRPPQPSPLPG